jgi:NAD(P)-dependent dehydrogenase (short-subunit alcohol dehydrogenase family)
MSSWDVSNKAVLMQRMREGFLVITKRQGVPEDMANRVAFLSNPLADLISGANFPVEGGMTPTTR